MRTRIFCLAPAISRPYQSTHACMHTHTRRTPRTHACMCTHTRVTFRPESKSDLGSCETILRDRLKRSLSHAPSARVRLALGTPSLYCIRARAYTSKRLRLRRLRLLVRACADDRTYVRTYVRTYINRLHCLALMRSVHCLRMRETI